MAEQNQPEREPTLGTMMRDAISELEAENARLQEQLESYELVLRSIANGSNPINVKVPKQVQQLAAAALAYGLAGRSEPGGESKGILETPAATEQGASSDVQSPASEPSDG